MIKTILLTSFISLALIGQEKCSDESKKDGCYKGRLEIKGICSNYTIKVLEGRIDTSKVAATWIDENTGRTYTNVFALDSPCSFPADIEQGDEFYFTLKEERDKDCNVCMAYYPTPPKRLFISVTKTPCP
jgi:hypothetical protein